jgi:selenocysteine lyase/cysteine desulfurase
MQMMNSTSEETAVDWVKVRAEFPALSNWTFLNTATFGQLPRCAADAMGRHLARRDQTACADFLSWYDDLECVRAACARLVNCLPSDIAFVPSASIGLSVFIQGLDWRPGDEVLTLENEFPNQLYASALLDRFEARHRTVAWPDFYAAVTERTRAVVISTVNYATGFRPPLDEIAHFLAARGVLLFADGTQSLGALQFDVRRTPVSVLCVDAYKWMISPNGAGFLYVSPELRARLKPTIVGWRSDRNWREVDFLNHGAPDFVESAEKYEGGALPFPSIYAMGASIDMLLAAGPAAIEARVLELAAKTRAMLRDLGAEVNADDSQIVTARFPDRDPGELARMLRQRRILVSARHGRLRVSSHLYNNEQDLDVLRLALR